MLGPWAPLDLASTVALFARAPFRWWISGGHALELFVGTSWRAHDDMDIGMLRRDADALPALLRGWDLRVASQGVLHEWDGGRLDAAAHENNVWCRRDVNGSWELDVTIGEGDEGAWVYRRDASVRVPWDDAVLHTSEGVPYLAPELQLLFKSKDVRAKDDADARFVVPRLPAARRERLATLLPATHPWRALARA